MFFFKRKRYSILESGLLQGMTDCHCHILPGVDDGIQTMDEALRALQKMAELGVSEIWLTPHIMEDIPNTPADLRQRFAELSTQLSTLNTQHSTLNTQHSTLNTQHSTLNTQLSTLNTQLSLHLAAEHMLDTLFMQRLANDDLLPYQVQSGKAEANSCVPSVASDQRSSASLFTLHSSLLVETSYFHPPMGLYDLLAGIRKKGYTPLLAHPERYMYMEDADYRRLRDMDVKLQLNILSLAGAYGDAAARKAHRLLHQNAYSCLGTDLHNLNDFLEYAEEKCLTKEEAILMNTLSKV
jgi:tyrosine-protein phosphatase YwqE